MRSTKSEEYHSLASGGIIIRECYSTIIVPGGGLVEEYARERGLGQVCCE